MDKKKALKIMEGLKEIQNYCNQVDFCTKCKLNGHNGCMLQRLREVIPSYWNVDEVIEEIQNEIELEEETTDGEPKKEIKSKGLSESNVQNLKAVQMFCEGHKDCDGCPLYKLGCIIRNMPKYWHLNWLEPYKDYDCKTSSDENLAYLFPNRKNEDSAPDMIHHPGHYNFRGMECMDFIEKFVSDPKSYYEGNILKYLYRYLEKNKEEDLNKSMEYTRLLKEYLYGKKD